MTQPPYGQQPSGPYQQNQQPPYGQNQPRPPYQQQPPNQPPYQQQAPNQPPYQYGPPSVAPQQGQGFGWGPQFAPPPPHRPPVQQGPPGPQGYPPQGPPPGYPPQGPGQGFPPPPHGFHQGPGFQPGWQPQLPRRKKSKAPLFAILGLVFVAVAGLWAFGVIKKNADNNYTQPQPSQPSYRVTEQPSPTVPTSSTEPTQEPTTSEPTSSEPTTTTTEKPQVSDLDTVAKNAIYKTGQMRSVGCKEPAVRPTTAANAAKYWAAIKPCLDQSWARQTALAGFTFRAPTMLYWSGVRVSTPCGNGAVPVPFYCPANHKMYMKVDNFVKTYNQYPDEENKAYSRMWYSRSIAHEYGHAMQSVTGILQATNRLEYEADSYADRIRITRRSELQANCFAGVFLAANKNSYPINGVMLRVWNKWVVTAGDKPNAGDHGSPASQARFMGRSFITGNPASCNTYAASAANVS
ncbi:neutral zinc metallopeptidase [Kribbella sp. NPDC056861]|uniref:neutral zinc metallopeptidase n=1 Tax=Kribbella sp. NPDC056861 TaxID=3154857 RepID=UPI003416A11F